MGRVVEVTTEPAFAALSRAGVAVAGRGEGPGNIFSRWWLPPLPGVECTRVEAPLKGDPWVKNDDLGMVSPRLLECGRFGFHVFHVWFGDDAFVFE